MRCVGLPRWSHSGASPPRHSSAPSRCSMCRFGQSWLTMHRCTPNRDVPRHRRISLPGRALLVDGGPHSGEIAAPERRSCTSYRQSRDPSNAMKDPSFLVGVLHRSKRGSNPLVSSSHAPQARYPVVPKIKGSFDEPPTRASHPAGSDRSRRRRVHAEREQHRYAPPSLKRMERNRFLSDGPGPTFVERASALTPGV